MVTGGFRLDLLLETAGLARSTYYYQLKQLDGFDKDKELKAEIQSIYCEHKGNYGYRRMTLELRNRGFMVNHKKVQRLMKAFFCILKSKMFYGYEKTFKSLEQLEQVIVDYIDYYNNKRIEVKLKHTKISSEEISDGRKYSLLFSLC